MENTLIGSESASDGVSQTQPETLDGVMDPIAVKSASSLIASLQTDLQDMSVSSTASTNELTQLKARMDTGGVGVLPISLVDENSLLQRQAQERNKLIDELRSKVDTLSTILMDNVSKNSRLEEQVKFYIKATNQLRERESILSRENAAYLLKLEHLSRDATTRFNAVTAEKESLLKVLEQKTKDASEKEIELRSENAALLQRLDLHSSDAAGTVALLRKERDSLQQQVRDSAVALAVLTREKESLQQQARETVELVSDLRRENHMVSEQAKSSSDSADLLKQENETLQRLAEEAASTIAQLRLEKETLLGETKDVSDTVAVLRQEKEKLVTQVNEFTEREKALVSENEGLIQKIERLAQEAEDSEALRSKITASEEVVLKLQGELVHAMENLLSTKQDLKELEDSEASRAVEASNYARAIEELTSELTQKKLELTEAQNSSEATRSRCDEVVASIESRMEDLKETANLHKAESARAKENLIKVRGAQDKWELEKRELMSSIESWKRISAGATSSKQSTSTVSPLPTRNTKASNPLSSVSSQSDLTGDGADYELDRRGLFSAPLVASPFPSTIMMDTARRTYMSVAEVVASGDIERMKNELIALAHHLENMRSSNARLLNKLQAARGNIQVCCRTRPPSVQELVNSGKICVDVIDDNELACYDVKSEIWRSFHFDRVWKLDSSQSEVFADVEPLVMSVIDGYNSCLLAYGQTGSGKTFTMNGYGDEYGVSYRTLNKVFETLAQRQDAARRLAKKIKTAAESKQRHSHGSRNPHNDSSSSLTAGEIDDAPLELTEDEIVLSEFEFEPFTYKVEVSILEIYNDQVHDLLVPHAADGSSPSMEIRQSADGQVFVPGLMQIRVFSIEDVMTVFARGSANRATAATNLNERSSRSHLILQVYVTTTTNDESPVCAKLSLVDLAGSERVSKSGSVGTTMKEAQYINKSLSALGDVMEALDQKQKHIPYRNSKLTYLLNDSLGGNSRTMMVVTLCPTEMTSEETLFTLQFATRVRNVTLGAARKNVNAKNLEDALKVIKSDLRDMRMKKVSLEDTVTNLRRELRAKSEKMHTQLDTKLKTIDEAKKSAELQIQQASRQSRELMMKLQEERTEKNQLALEVSAYKRDLRKVKDRLKEVQAEREALLTDLKAKDRDSSQARGRQIKAAIYDDSSPSRCASPERDYDSSVGRDRDRDRDRERSRSRARSPDKSIDYIGFADSSSTTTSTTASSSTSAAAARSALMSTGPDSSPQSGVTISTRADLRPEADDEEITDAMNVTVATVETDSQGMDIQTPDHASRTPSKLGLAARRSSTATYASLAVDLGSYKYDLDTDMNTYDEFDSPTRPNNLSSASPASANYRPRMTPRSKEALLKHQERLAKAKARASL